MSSRLPTRVAQEVTRHVRPILSVDRDDARRRVHNLYRAWYRQIPYIVHGFRDVTPLTERMLRDKVKQLIYANRHVTDIRVIDMLIIRGQMELNDTVNKFKQESHLMAYFNKNIVPPKPKDFISKFLAGSNNE